MTFIVSFTKHNDPARKVYCRNFDSGIARTAWIIAMFPYIDVIEEFQEKRLTESDQNAGSSAAN